MTIIGRITKDAIVNTTKSGRKVVNFSLAINESYRPKGGEWVKVTTYCNCSYWLSERMAEHLKKGTLLEVTGRIYVTPYVGKDGTAKASLNCHVSAIKIHACSKDAGSGENRSSAVATAATDDVPF